MKIKAEKLTTVEKLEMLTPSPEHLESEADHAPAPDDDTLKLHVCPDCNGDGGIKKGGLYWECARCDEKGSVYVVGNRSFWADADGREEALSAHYKREADKEYCRVAYKDGVRPGKVMPTATILDSPWFVAAAAVAVVCVLVFLFRGAII